MAPALERKPSRSEDDVLDLEQQRTAEEAVRHKFEELAPKRAPKPLRSEYHESQEDEPYVASGIIPEHLKFQDLAASAQRIIQEFPVVVSEEFTETEYYKDLNAVDRSLHHTTGSGFIQVEKGVVEFNLAPSGGGLVRTRSQCNPATNDWVPSADPALVSSDKPSRSDP